MTTTTGNDLGGAEPQPLGAARWAAREKQRHPEPEPEPRYYTPDRLGPKCRGGCGTKMPHALAKAGILTHPTCDRTAPQPPPIDTRGV